MTLPEGFEWKKIQKCHCCDGSVSAVSNDMIYGATVGEWPYVYLCDDEKCGAYVGCHHGTDKPLGRMADARTRRARQAVHAAFDPIWKSGKMSRREAYKWLAEQLQINFAECHIGMFNVARCEQAINSIIRSGIMH